MIQSARINDAHAASGSVLISDVHDRQRRISRESGQWHRHQTDAAAAGHIEKCGSINVRTVIKHALHAKLEAAALTHYGAATDESHGLRLRLPEEHVRVFK